MTGPLALVGGGEWSEGCSFDAELLAASGGTEVVVLPTAAAFENPNRYVERATAWFEGLGATVRSVPVLQRTDAMDPANAEAVGAARFLYLAGDSPMHLRSVLKDTPVWHALVRAWEGGAVLVGSGGAGSGLLDPMFDPRGGAFTVGLGLVKNLALLPDAEDDVAEHHRRTLELAEPNLVLATVQRCTALINEGGSWRAAGAGRVRVFVSDEEKGLDALP
ncbi:MAG: cysnophycinase-like exopeptidase [Actinomycetia bacterium]|nr:cysnophycinase-like exopeptidase [Actinomycetes bacterium]